MDLVVGHIRPSLYFLDDGGRAAIEEAIAAHSPAGSQRHRPAPGSSRRRLVKLAFADNGAKTDLLASLRRFRDQAETRRQELRSIFEEYVRRDDPFPERIHVNVVAYRLLWQTTQAELAWADWAIDEIEQWTDTKTSAERGRFISGLEAALEE